MTSRTRLPRPTRTARSARTVRVSRSHAWLTLAALFILGAALAWGLVIFLWSLAAHTGPSDPGSPTGPGTGTPSEAETGRVVAAAPAVPGVAVLPPAADVDELAARPMATAAPAAALPQPIAAVETATALSIPAARDAGAALPTGFPHTPEGAVAQLAAIDAAAFRDLNPAAVADVHRRATLPGAVDLTQWTPNVGVTAILTAAGQPRGSAAVTATWTFTHAQVKGVLTGGDFVLACVLGELDATYRTTARAGVGDCQRMLWHDDRWRIGPGAQPAYAPSTWPGSADCVRAGWREAHHA